MKKKFLQAHSELIDIVTEIKKIGAPHPKFGNDIYIWTVIIFGIFFLGLYLMLKFN